MKMWNPQRFRLLSGMLLLMSFFSNSAMCQEQFVPIPNDLASRYHFDLARNYFPSPEAERTERTRYEADLKQLEGLKGKVAASADDLLHALQLYDQIQVEYLRHYQKNARKPRPQALPRHDGQGGDETQPHKKRPPRSCLGNQNLVAKTGLWYT